MFHYVVHSSLQGGNTRFALGTFNFRQACRRWNETAIGFPQLWSSWVAGAVKAWPMFNSRSKDSPLSLTWRPQLPKSARRILMDSEIPRRTRQLDFSGTSSQLVHFLHVFDSSPPSNVSSIRLQVQVSRPAWKKIAPLLSSHLRELSKLNVGSFLPVSSSPIFTTSKLTSLKLFLPYGGKDRYTLAQFTQIHQQHPNLQELDLNHGAIPLPGPQEVSTPFVLPRLTDLRLHGTKGAIFGLINLLGMSSPLHNVVIRFGYINNLTIPTLASTMEKVLVAYYDCQGLGYPRKIDSLTISSPWNGSCLTFDARSRSAPTSNLKLQSYWPGGFRRGKDEVVEKIFALFPSDNIQEFAVEGLPLTGRMLRKVKDLSHLRLRNQNSLDLERALLSLGHQGTFSKSTMRILNFIHAYR